MRLRWLSVPILLGSGVVLGLNLAAPPNESSADVRFARDMSAHHTQAVTMSETILQRAQDPAVRLLARDVMLTQQAQVGQMNGWLMAWGRPLSGKEAPMAGMDRAKMGLASPAEITTLTHLSTELAETRYLSLMRLHHIGGVAMAKAALHQVRRPEVKAFAARVVEAQTAEIAAIDRMLKTRMNASSSTPEMGDMSHE